jgi:hypothetical protein
MRATSRASASASGIGGTAAWRVTAFMPASVPARARGNKSARGSRRRRSMDYPKPRDGLNKPPQACPVVDWSVLHVPGASNAPF